MAGQEEIWEGGADVGDSAEEQARSLLEPQEGEPKWSDAIRLLTVGGGVRCGAGVVVVFQGLVLSWCPMLLVLFFTHTSVCTVISCVVHAVGVCECVCVCVCPICMVLSLTDAVSCSRVSCC